MQRPLFVGVFFHRSTVPYLLRLLPRVYSLSVASCCFLLLLLLLLLWWTELGGMGEWELGLDQTRKEQTIDRSIDGFDSSTETHTHTPWL